MSVKNPLFPSAAKTVLCDSCGYPLPLDLGQNSKNCAEWAGDTLKKLPPAGHTVSMLMDLITFTRLCDVLAKLRMREQPLIFPPAGQVTPPKGEKNG